MEPEDIQSVLTQFFGASIIVRYSNGDEEAYRIVGVDEADPAFNRISWVSPLARALLGFLC
jgi:transcription elongation factor GreB